MTDLILYVIESSALLVVFYTMYAAMLSRETCFQFNRFILLAIPLLSLGLPLLRIEIDGLNAVVVERSVNEISKLTRAYYDAMAGWEFETPVPVAGEIRNESAPKPYGWLTLFTLLAGLVYFAGVVVCLSRTAWTIRWISRMIDRNPHVTCEGVKVVKLHHPTAPFSFLNCIFVHAPAADTADFEQILAHERIHIKEKHSIDLLFIQLMASLLWFNPVIWRLIKSLKTIHEYIADKKIIQLGYSVSAYQTLLLRQLISNNSIGLVHNFNLSFIKKRITMMTTEKSGWSVQLKASAALLGMIVCGAMIIQCNTKLDEQMAYERSDVGDIGSHLSLPVLPASKFRFDADLTNAGTFMIRDNRLWINGTEATIETIALLDSDDYGRSLPVIMMIDKDQPMGFVGKVHMALREADRRKVLYIGHTSGGERVEVPITLPPDPKTLRLPDVSEIPGEYLLTINLTTNEGAINKNRVYDFVMDHHSRGEAEKAVVSAKMDDGTSYGAYLLNLFYIRDGYTQIYEERSRTLFRKGFYETTKDEYRAVREHIPMNISIAEH